MTPLTFPDMENLLKQEWGEALLLSEIRYDELTLIIKPDALISALEFLKKHPALLFLQLIDMCGTDYLEIAEPRFEVVYHLLSLKHNQRMRLKIQVDETDKIPSATAVFESANWLEREIFDMFGLRFSGHPDLRRLLTDYDFEGYPLRKDFPLTGYVEVRYDDEKKSVVYEPVNLPQAYRTFDFESPWEGMDRAFEHNTSLDEDKGTDRA